MSLEIQHECDFEYYLDIKWKIFDGDVAGRLEHSMTQPCHL